MGDMSLEEKRETLVGHMYETIDGQLVIDACPTEAEHLLARQTHAEQPLHRCRTYAKDLLPAEWLGKPGKFLVDRTVTKHGDVIAVRVAFIPQVDV